MRAIRKAPLSAVFSPRVNFPFSFTPSVASKPEYSSLMHCAIRSYSLLSSAVHLSWRLVPVAVEFPALIIKPMGQLVPNICRDGSEICRIIRLPVK